MYYISYVIHEKKLQTLFNMDRTYPRCMQVDIKCVLLPTNNNCNKNVHRQHYSCGRITCIGT